MVALIVCTSSMGVACAERRPVASRETELYDRPPPTAAPTSPRPVAPMPPAPSMATPQPEKDRARPPEFANLEVLGFESAVVSFPPFARLPQPVLISTHGAGDSATEMCELWRHILGDRGVVLCPAGPRMRAHEAGRYYPDHHALERITFASVHALAEKYRGLVDVERALYVGYSQGATMGALMIPSHGGECPRLVLVEGGFDGWSVERATVFAKSGGERALFVCGRQRCRSAAERSASWLRSAGVKAKVVSRIGEGHAVRVAEAAGPELEWLLQGDPRWR